MVQYPTRRVFSAERRMLEQAGATPPPGNGSVVSDDPITLIQAAIAEMRDDLLQEIRSLKALRTGDAPASPTADGDPALTREEQHLLMKDADELALVKNEIRALTFSIEHTKGEIAALYKARGEGNRLDAVASELDAVVRDTEEATGRIMDIAEKIDDSADQLTASAEGNGHLMDIAEAIQSNIVKMYEACNFQDLTGQRITKVVNTLHLIDERLAKITEIWGREDMEDYEVPEDPTGLDGLAKTIDRHPDEVEKVDQAQADHLMSQDDLDALFD